VSQDGEELLEFGRPPRPRWIRNSVAGVVVLALAVVVVLRMWPHSSHRGLAPQPTSTYPVGPSSAGSSSYPRPWPTAPEACGGDTDLAIVSSTKVAQPTGLRLLIGGSTARTVDFDTGHSTALAGVELRPGEYVTPSGPNVWITSTCPSGPASGSRLVRVGTDGSATVATLPPGSTRVLVDGLDAWSVSSPNDPSASSVLTPLGGGAPVQLPASFAPAAIMDGVLVGDLVKGPLTGSDSREDPLVLVDAATGQIRQHLGPGTLLAAGAGLVLWTVGCRAGSGQPCTLNELHLGGGLAHSYHLPRPPGFIAGVVSPDGQRVAFLMEHSGQDPRYDQGHPIPPGDVVVLHLGIAEALDVIPGVEVPAKAPPGLAFSADGAWLVMAFNAGSATRLLAWRPGLSLPYESAPVAGPVVGAPAIVALA
jgi:hypothetical protein